MGSTVTALAAIAAVFFTVQQGKADIGTTQEGQLAERYTAAVTNLGDQSPDVRLGGIYAMQRIMKDSPTYQPAVVDVLSAYVRTHARSSGKESAGYKGRPEADVHSAFEVLTRRLPQHDDKAEVDLREAYLPHIGLRGPAGPDGTTGSPQLAEANLSGAILRDANLARADLRKAYLVGTDLEKTDLIRADLSAAQLYNTTLDHGQLDQAQLREASVVDTSLVNASLQHADLRNADLRGTDLTGANLAGTDLRGAYLRDQPIRQVNGKPSEWQSKKSTKVTVEQLLAARIDTRTELPPELAKNPKIRERIASEKKGITG
ncbi:pentapeptide repeat-containing protein [Streptomyces flavidovirens]|uniref:pentapeptide repeat-containing protein n=1 Tax=Streptomyces flavidovirens TaxID=67298 RepID=UPI0036A1DC73